VVSNEIAAIPELLRVLELKGALVTIDAAGTQVEIAKQIREQGGDYLLAVKGNQPTLQAAVQAVFDQACAADFAGVHYDMHATAESGHGRQEERYVTVIYEPEGLPAEWPDVAAVVLVGRERKIQGKNASTSHYYLTSRRAQARRLGEAIRGHWGIENGLHWVLDVADCIGCRERTALGVELTVLQRGEQLVRRKELYLARYPQTKRGGAPGKAGGGKKAKAEIISAFAADVAAKSCQWL
jgi:predicted transposase YbfD/YdcC